MVLWPGGRGKEKGMVVFSPSWGPRQDPPPVGGTAQLPGVTAGGKSK